MPPAGAGLFPERWGAGGGEIWAASEELKDE